MPTKELSFLEGIEKMKCKDCESELQKTTIPKTIYSINIPFTPLTLEIWNWEAEDWFCFECATEKDQRPYEDAYVAGVDKGYEERLREAQERLYE